jgi:hypothetical protein
MRLVLRSWATRRKWSVPSSSPAVDVAQIAEKKPVATTTEPDEESICNLMSMGFERKNVIKALKKHPRSESRAIEFLLEGGMKRTIVFFILFLWTTENHVGTGGAADEQDDVQEAINASLTEPPAPPSGSPKPKARTIPMELQRLFARLQLSAATAVSTEGLTRSFGWIGREASVQHDVQELNRYSPNKADTGI